jgi:hypothetical protein
MEANKVQEKITLWMDDLSNNAIEPGSGYCAFDWPLIGFASGDDELLRFIK